MSYCLVWKDEIIESEIATRSEAEYLLGEYQMAYNDPNIKIVRERDA